MKFKYKKFKDNKNKNLLMFTILNKEILISMSYRKIIQILKNIIRMRF